jgi:beta-galactosidase
MLYLTGRVLPPLCVLILACAEIGLAGASGAPAVPPRESATAQGHAPTHERLRKSSPASSPATISLAGRWQFQLDPQDVGLKAKWFQRDLDDSIQLPGTTDEAKKGFQLDLKTMTYPVDVLRTRWPGTKDVLQADRAGYLVRPWYYVGKAWYQRTLDVPADWAGRFVRLRLERVIWQTRVWLDDRAMGSCDSLVAQHRYDLGVLPPGRHRLTICVDNDLVHNIGIIGHAYGPETQSRWNGIVGRIDVTASSPIFVHSVQVYPAADQRRVRVVATLQNATGHEAEGKLRLSIRGETGSETVAVGETTVPIKPGRQTIEQTLQVTRPVQGWDEFHPVRYRLVTELQAAGSRHTRAELFGFRTIRRVGRALEVNGRRVFLRGTLDCCVYPKTAYPPMTVDAWLRLFSTIQDHGFNHVRYHSWCPPEAAFEAADRLGIYLAPETPFWVDEWSTGTASHPQLLGEDADALDYVRREVRRIADTYGNHPSFALFCLGNEFGMGGDWDLVNRLVVDARRHDPRRLYSATTARRHVPADDFWVTHSTGKASTRGIGPPQTDWDFAAAFRSVDVPTIAHETGQRPVFPDYDHLLPKFTGPLKPLDLVRLQRQLRAADLAGQVKAFQRASARFQYVLYKAEHEALQRTPDCAGYQLLMLNDFTGQSEALVGILDPFWEPKGIVTAAEVRQWNAPTVALARFGRYTWTSAETFRAAIEVAHFGPTDLAEETARWSLTTAAGTVVGQGSLGPRPMPTGGLTQFGSIAVPLERLRDATALRLRVSLGAVHNAWTIWVYPPPPATAPPADVVITRRFDRAAQDALEGGGRVLLLAHGRRGSHTVQTGFPSVYWSAGWSPNRITTLGVLCDPQHPALASFPNDGYSDWQWYELTRNATTFVLTGAPHGLRPIVRAVTDFHQNRRLGQVLEARVGRGRLLVCGYDLERDLERRHAPRQLRQSLLRYLTSDAFQPRVSLTTAQLDQWLGEENGRPSN